MKSPEQRKAALAAILRGRSYDDGVDPELFEELLDELIIEIDRWAAAESERDREYTIDQMQRQIWDVSKQIANMKIQISDLHMRLGALG